MDKVIAMGIGLAGGMVAMVILTMGNVPYWPAFAVVGITALGLEVCVLGVVGRHKAAASFCLGELLACLVILGWGGLAGAW